MKEYNHKIIEEKWQKVWESTSSFQAHEDPHKKKFYALIEFPYPSGEGLHVGHVRSNTAMDIIARKRRREGYSVLYPIGWDAFGLPTENYAIKTGTPPQEVTKKNTDTFRRQLKALGFSFDWSREINTSDPHYYKWTQWIFLKLFESGLAYKKKIPINWCLDCKTGRANEEIVGGMCERCGGEVEIREKEQWLLKITDYAERLFDDLDEVDYLPHIKAGQRNWIGKSTGAEIFFQCKDATKVVTVFTTRPDTIFGATYLVLAPEHPLLEDEGFSFSNKEEVKAYSKKAQAKKDTERTAEGKDKTGVLLEGVSVVNPANKEEIPIFVADYVLPHYGTGAIMAVPAHDERDWEFAKKYALPIKEVIVPNIIDKKNPPVSGKKIVERKNVHAIVKNPKTGKYLGLKWKEFDWLTFPMGGVEAGEDFETAARREVREETGYINLKLVKVLEGTVRAEYFAAHKDENRTAYTQAVVFELVDETKEEITKEEKDAHEIVWLNTNDLNYAQMAHAEVEHWHEKLAKVHGAYEGEGVLINSGELSGLSSEDARKKAITLVGGEEKTTFKLRDWIFSRQRYWGEPIPIILCEKCGPIALSEEDLPLELPIVSNYTPTDSGESPLASVSEWVNVSCPRCDAPAKRETDTMPNWAGSSWYYLRYTDPHNSDALAGKDKLAYWLPVDWYNGGMEHTTLHLLYSRFWHKFLFDKGVVPTKEPYAKRTAHGMILGPDGAKMSKSKGNIINPDDVVARLGADTMRVYQMFMGPFDEMISWNDNNIAGARRFLEKVWRLQEKVSKETVTQEILEKEIHRTIKKVTEDIELAHFNTAISSLMIFSNTLDKEEVISQELYETLVLLVAPFAPHIAEEIWHEVLKKETSIHEESWPVYDEEKLHEETLVIVVQVNGKVRGKLSVSQESSEEEIKQKAGELPEVQKWLEGETLKQVIYVKGRLVNLVL